MRRQILFCNYGGLFRVWKGQSGCSNFLRLGVRAKGGGAGGGCGGRSAGLWTSTNSSSPSTSGLAASEWDSGVEVEGGRGVGVSLGDYNSDVDMKKADVVVCGGGIVAKHHFDSVFLLEQASIGGGSTWLSNGFISPNHLWSHPQVQELACYSAKFYKELATEFPSIDFRECGRLFLAHSTSSELALRRMHSFARAHEYKVRLVSVKELENLNYPVDISDVKLGLLSEEDAISNSYQLCEAIAGKALQAGVKIRQDCRVNAVCVGDSKEVYGVETDFGFVSCKRFLDATGLWAGSVQLKGYSDQRLKFPMQPCTYSYLVAKNFSCPENMPVIHSMDDKVYLAGGKEKQKCGGFLEESIRPEFIHAPPSPDFNFQELTPDWDLFYPVLEKLNSRFPALGEAQVLKLVSGAECYTPDGQVLVGQTPQIRGYYVASGMCGFGTSLAGGVGKVLGEWMGCDGRAMTRDVSKIDIARLLGVHSNSHYLQQRAPEIASLSYQPLYNSHMCRSARNLRKSPIYQQLKDVGAVFGEIMGYERPLYFLTDKREVEGRIVKTRQDEGQESLLGKPSWFHSVAKEYEACRERVGLIDMSHFSKFEIFSEDDEVVSFLQRICSADIDKPVGTTIYTGMQHDKGGYVTDCTISRIGRNHYFMIAPTVQQVRCKMWMESHLPWGSRVVIQDVTSMYTALNVLGPSSRYLIQDLTNHSLNPAHFPAFSCKTLDVGYASGIRAISVTHCGELGWVLYIPNEYAQHVYDRLIECGKEYGLRNAGYLTLRHLRIEKFYVFWGMDIDYTTTPSECGRLFRVNTQKGDFIGKEALLAEKVSGVKRRYIQLLLEDHDSELDPWPQGLEPIYRDGVYSGLTTTASYGFTLKCQVCLGFVVNRTKSGEAKTVTSDFVNKGSYEVDIGGTPFPARVSLHSPMLPMVSSEHPAHYRPTR